MRPNLRFKDGVVLKHAHFLPHMTTILQAAIVAAPDNLVDSTVWVTCAHRDIRESLDFHELCAAFDFRCKNIDTTGAQDPMAARRIFGGNWATRMLTILTPDYDVVAHGEGDNFHIHAEFDPR